MESAPEVDGRSCVIRGRAGSWSSILELESHASFCRQAEHAAEGACGSSTGASVLVRLPPPLQALINYCHNCFDLVWFVWFVWFIGLTWFCLVLFGLHLF